MNVRLYAENHPPQTRVSFTTLALFILVVTLLFAAFVHVILGEYGGGELQRNLAGVIVVLLCSWAWTIERNGRISNLLHVAGASLGVLIAAAVAYGFFKVVVVGNKDFFLLGWFFLFPLGPCFFIRFASEVAYPKRAKHPKDLDEIARIAERRFRAAEGA